MSVENQNASLHLQRVELSGYKTIKNTKIDLIQGLNIIIGINGVGKTNFLTFLYKALVGKLNDINQVQTRLVFVNSEEVEVICKSRLDNSSKKSLSNAEQVTVSHEIDTQLFINKKLIETENGEIRRDVFFELRKQGVFYQTSFIGHGLPQKSFHFVNNPYSCTFNPDSSDINIFSQQSSSYFIQSVLIAIFFEFLPSPTVDRKIALNEKVIKEKLGKALKMIDEIKEPLKKYSPIQDIRFTENINIFIDAEKNKANVSNIFLEFKVDNSWHSFNNLSDGTKRMFYIIAEVAFPIKYYYTRYSAGRFSDKEKLKRVILIEEPELGVHPHQLFKIMQFLKEEASDKQIIISTHSPEVINQVIDKESELERIIIASDEKDEGTMLRHMNEGEIDKAKKYMTEGYLSDYWVHSNLEFKYH